MKEYLSPKLEITFVIAQDVIRTSGEVSEVFSAEIDAGNANWLDGGVWD